MRIDMRQVGSAALILLCVVVVSSLFVLTLETIGWLAALGVMCLSAPLLGALVARSPLVRRMTANRPPESAALHPAARATRASRLVTEIVVISGGFLLAALIIGTHLWLGLIPSLLIASITAGAAYMYLRRMSGTKQP